MTLPTGICGELPIDSCLPEIVATIAESTPVVLKAPPGAGKTTGVPPALMRFGAAGPGEVLLVQPRRLAARAAASRLARLMGGAIGQQVGYHVRFDRCASADTRLLAVTTGVLLRRLHSDPLLENVSCVLLDEFHERSVEVDLALGMLHRIRTTLRPELKLLVMSATLDPQPIVDFLGDARVVTSQGRSFPVDVHYRAPLATPGLARPRIDQQVAAALPEMLAMTCGHVLVFLPGVGEIRSTRRTILARGLAEGCAVLELYGDLDPQDQDAVLSAGDRRKIILSTNVAETSVTIPGVTGVIDSGLARVMRHDAHVGLPRLQLEPISQASADQRCGRAGRTQPGVCFRLWPQAAHHARRAADTPEVLRCDFSPALLMLAGWGEREVFDFPWLSPPPGDAVTTARRLLVQLGAIDQHGGLTDLGAEMLRLPLHPRLARFLIQADALGVADDAALAAAMLTERDPFRADGRGGAAPASAPHGCDLRDRIEQLKSFLRSGTPQVPHPAAARHVQRVARQILRTMQSARTPWVLGPVPAAERLPRALLAAYPDRVARRRADDEPRGVMVGGRGVRLDARSMAQAGPLFLCIDIDAKGVDATVRAASVIEESWLDPRMIREVDQYQYQPSLLAVVCRRRRYFQDLILRQWPVPCRPGPEVAALLFAAARENLKHAFPRHDQPIASFIDRVQFLVEQMPELNLPPLDEPTIEQVLLELCQTRTSMAELRAAAWLDHLRSRYDYQQSQWIDKYAPQRITVPSSNAIAVHYGPGKPPSMEVRIQELFGWKTTPRVAGGRVAVQLHLLGPNHRPQQITEDLESFWSQTYAEVRKELRRRYPKHHWPEDPTVAAATRNGLQPRS